MRGRSLDRSAGKGGVLLCLGVFFFATGSLGAQSTTAEARISELRGRVEILQPGDSWRPAVVGMVLPLGTTVSTGFGATAVMEIGPALLQVEQLSRMTIEDLAEREGVLSSDLYLQVGRVRAEVRRTTGRQNNFRLRSPVATAAVRGTSFEFDGVNLSVDTGSVLLSNPQNISVVVEQGESSSSPQTGEAPVAVADALEAVSTVQVYTAPPGETRSEGARTEAQPVETASIRLDFVIEGYN